MEQNKIHVSKIRKPSCNKICLECGMFAHITMKIPFLGSFYLCNDHFKNLRDNFNKIKLNKVVKNENE